MSYQFRNPRCPACPGIYAPIEGDGPMPCPVLALGERPGKTENLRQRVFCGPSGEETNNTYFPLAGLFRGQDFRLENVCRCWADSNRTPTAAEVESCAGHFLPGVFEQCQPEFLILLGAQAGRILDQPLRLEIHHGRPQWGSVLGGLWEGWVWAMYHPAAGLREGNKMTALLEDFGHLGEWFKGEWEPPLPPPAVTKDYSYCDTVGQFDRYVENIAAVLGMACDTETHGREKFSIQISHTPHTGRMILASNQPVVRAFQEWARATSADWVFHFAAHDMDELERYGVQIPVGRWRDTLQELYHLTNLPQGLKAAAYRLLGVTMHSWADTVWPTSIEAFADWARGALVLGDVELGLQNKIETTLKRGKCVECGHLHSKGPCKRDGCGCVCTEMSFVKVEYKIGAAVGVLKHIMRYVESPDQDPDTPYHPWKKLEEMKETGLRGKVPEKWEWLAIEEQMGPTPILGIGNCSSDEALRYAVGDSDMTLQVAGELVKIRAREHGEFGGLSVDREDWDS